MAKLKLHYATNPNHLGRDRWHLDDYGARFSSEGMGPIPLLVDRNEALDSIQTRLFRSGAVVLQADLPSTRSSRRRACDTAKAFLDLVLRCAVDGLMLNSKDKMTQRKKWAPRRCKERRLFGVATSS